MNYKNAIDTWKIGSLYSTSNTTPMKEYAAAGIDCIEFILPSKHPIDNYFLSVREKAENIVEAVLREKLELMSLHLPYGKQWDISTRDTVLRKKVIDTLSQIFPWIAGYGVHELVIHPSPSDVLDEEREERFNICRTALSTLYQLATSYKLKLALENMSKETSLGNTSKDILRILEPFPGIGVCCDTNHALIETTEEFIVGVGTRITTVHISDYDRKDEKHILPGKGVNNWQKILELLVNYGYPGPFIYEVQGVDNHPKILYDNWQSLKNG